MEIAFKLTEWHSVYITIDRMYHTEVRLKPTSKIPIPYLASDIQVAFSKIMKQEVPIDLCIIIAKTVKEFYELQVNKGNL